MIKGFFFNSKHSHEFGIAMEHASRGLLPSLRRNDYEITGRHGTIAYGNETYSTRQISVDICFISGDIEKLQIKARDIAFWLSGKGMLIFDDEPDKAYEAKIYDAIDTEQLIMCKRATLTFVCQPFATSINYFQKNHTVQGNKQEIEILSKGTQPAPCIIMIKNIGSNNIQNIEITRKAGNR